MTEYSVTYAQNREDAIIKGFFPNLKKGFYVDVGANHPQHDSVTKLFYDQGWTGINIEPNPNLFRLLQSARPKDINLQLGVSNQQGKLTLREYPEGDGLSTFSKSLQESYIKEPNNATRTYKDYEVPVQPLKNILRNQKVSTIQFMKVDVEGYEYEVLNSNDWEKYRPQLLCVESNHIDKDWRPLLKKKGYEFVFFDGINDYYVAKEHIKIGKNFSYPQALLANPPVPHEVLAKTTIMKWQLKQVEQKLTHQELLINSLRSDVHDAHVSLSQRSRIRSLVRQLLAATNGAIVTQVNKLDRPKVRRQEPIHLTADESTEEMLQLTRLYDLQRYYRNATSKPLTYRLVNGFYALFYKVARLMLRGTARVLRKVKHG